jgi:hypothetical protein
MGVGIRLLTIILAMALLVVAAGAVFRLRQRRQDSRTEPLEITIDMIGGPDCEGCRAHPPSRPKN